MNIKKLFLLLSVMIVCSINIAGAGGKASTGWSLFRKLQSVKPMSLSSTYWLPGDLSGVLYNPSLLADIERKEVDLTTGFGYADERIAGVMYSFPYGSKLNLAAGVFNYDYGKMELSWIENDTILDRTVSAQSDYLSIISAGKKLNKKLNAGLNLKVASSRIAEEATAYAFALDGGLTYSVNRKLSAVVAAQNVGFTTKFINKAEKLPTSVMAGLSYFQNVASGYVLTGCAVPYLVSEARTIPEIGIEIGKWPFGVFAGYKTYADESALSYGLSVTTKKYDFSYSYTPAQWLDTMHRMAFSIKLDKIEDIRNEIRLAYKSKASERAEKKRQKRLEKQRIAKEKQLAIENEKQEQIRKQKEVKERIQQLVSSSTFKVEFHIQDVVDSRSSEVIGYEKQKGKSYGKRFIIKEGMRAFIFNNFENYVTQKDRKVPIIMKILSLSIEDGREIINAEAKAEFYIVAGNQVGKIYTAVGFVEKSAEEKVEDIHLLNIMQVLDDCIRQFAVSDWVNKEIVYRDSSILYKDKRGLSKSVHKRSIDKYTTRIGLGLGIPYGVLGGNFEVNTGDYLSLTCGVGYSPGGAAYSVGGRLYTAVRDKKFRPCVSMHYGVVAVLEKKIYSYSYYGYSSTSSTEYENVNGSAFGVGFKYNKVSTSWDFDILYLNYNMPAYTQQQTGNVKISVGYGWHF